MTDHTFIITFGGWYQRTTLHLTEIFDLFAFGTSRLPLAKEKLTEHHARLNFAEVTREAGYFEFVRAKTQDGIEVRYYEDGLYVLEVKSRDIAEGRAQLSAYYETILGPAISYIFSLGAPTPKVLANIQTVHPTVVSVTHADPSSFLVNTDEFGVVYSSIAAQGITVYKTPHYIFVVAKEDFGSRSADLVEMQIFFREFKDQLEKYLQIHRTLWEEISTIKERKAVRGTEVEYLRAKLDAYEKTISLIGNRINQMGAYVRTRSSIARGLEIEKHLVTLFQFKFEALTDTLDYIQELWKMTADYLLSAIQNIVEIKNQSTARGIQSLQLITSIGVVSGIIGYLSRNEFPTITALGALYFFIIVIATWFVNAIITKIYTRKKYALQLTERVSNI